MMPRNRLSSLLLAAGLLMLSACGPSDGPAPDEQAAADAGPAAGADEAAAGERLDAVLAAQPTAVRARYPYRHPKETLRFFRIEPGMSVVEVLPGGGWYSKILLPYLGSDGRLIGADYAIDMWPKFGFYDDEALAAKAQWTETWPAQAGDWAGEDGAAVAAFNLGELPAGLAGSADAMLMVRALHHLARFEDAGGYLTEALASAREVLRAGGLVGVVQHRAPADAPDDWADGSAGYLKESFVIDRFEAAGFELVARSEINSNPQDEPTPEDIVWRLPPTLMTSQDNPDAMAAFEAIGESDRMTLLFRKPAAGGQTGVAQLD